MTPEYAKRVFEPLDKYHHGDLSLNDYRTKDDKRTEYEYPPMSPEELRQHMEERAEWEDLNNDLIPW